MVPRSVEWDRVVTGGDGADIGEPDECRAMPRSAD